MIPLIRPQPGRPTVEEKMEHYRRRCLICGAPARYGSDFRRAHLACLDHPEAGEVYGPGLIQRLRAAMRGRPFRPAAAA